LDVGLGLEPGVLGYVTDGGDKDGLNVMPLPLNYSEKLVCFSHQLE